MSLKIKSRYVNGFRSFFRYVYSIISIKPFRRIECSTFSLIDVNSGIFN